METAPSETRALDAALTQTPFQTRMAADVRSHADRVADRWAPERAGGAGWGRSLGHVGFVDRLLAPVFSHSALATNSLTGLWAQPSPQAPGYQALTRSAVSWVFPRPWYLDELEWVESAKQAHAGEDLSNFEWSLVAPSLDTQDQFAEVWTPQTRPEQVQAQRILRAQPQASASARIAHKRLTSVLVSPPRAKAQPVTSSQELLAHSVAAAPAHIAPAGGPRVRFAAGIGGAVAATRKAPTRTVAAPRAVSHVKWVDQWLGRFSGVEPKRLDRGFGQQSPRAVTPPTPVFLQAPAKSAPILADDEVLSDDMLASFAAPQAALQPKTAPRAHRASPALTHVVIPQTAGFSAAMASSPFASEVAPTLGVQAAPVSDARSFEPTTLLAAAVAPGFEWLAAPVQEAETTWTAMPGATAHGLRNDAVATHERAAGLSFDFVAPEMAIAAEHYGLEPGDAQVAQRWASGDDHDLHVQAARLDRALVAPTSIGASREVADASAQPRRNRGVYMWPEAARTALKLQLPDVGTIEGRKQLAALELVVAERVANAKQDVEPGEVPSAPIFVDLSQPDAAESPSIRAARAFTLVRSGKAATLKQAARMSVRAAMPVIESHAEVETSSATLERRAQDAQVDLRAVVNPAAAPSAANDTPVVQPVASARGSASPSVTSSSPVNLIRRTPRVGGPKSEIPDWFEAAARRVLAEQRPSGNLSLGEMTLIQTAQPDQLAAHAHGAQSSSYLPGPDSSATQDSADIDAEEIAREVADKVKQMIRLNNRRRGA